MPYINTANLSERDDPNATRNLQIYNGLDCCVTLEVWHRLRAELAERPNCNATFEFRMRLLAPLLEMSLRGIKVNIEARDEAIKYLTEISEKLQAKLDLFASAVWDKGLNPRSPTQLQQFFYTTLRMQPIYQSFKGERRVTTNIAALEKLSLFLPARLFVNHILAIRSATKLLGVLRSGIDRDNRMRTSYNAGGTETGRLSSNKNVFGGGTNLQNITERLRKIFEADAGYKLAVPDLEQAESRAVAGIMIRDFNDFRYHEACNSGDLHTTVAKMVWPGLAWPNDPRGDRKLAEQIFYRHFSYRDMSKRGGHGSNYRGMPPTMAKHLHVEVKLMEDFQSKYFGAFGMPKWHKRVAQEIMTKHMLTTPFGMERIFFGRPEDDATIREAIAFEPQSTVGEYMNRGLLAIWQHERRVILLLQIHDAVGFLYPDDPELEPEILTNVQRLLAIPLQYGNTTITIPSEMKVGWNWGNYDGFSNPNGLKKWKGRDDRKREAGRLDQLLSTLYRSNPKS